jgi:hypothetical protein
MKKRSFLQSFNPVKMQIVDTPPPAEGVVVSSVRHHPSELVAVPVTTGTADVSQCGTVSRDSLIDSSPSEQIAAPVSAAPSNSPVPSSQGNVSSPSACISHAPPSPNANRQSFLNGFIPARTCCNLDLCRVPAESKFTITAICMAVYPPSKNPERRYVQLCDDTGATGITVWNSNVAKFNSGCVGKLVTCVKVAMSNYNGKRILTMTRDSSIQIINEPNHPVMSWWSSLLEAAPKSCGAVHDLPDGSIVCVQGILGLVSEEVKMVNGVERSLTYLHLVDSTGRVDVRTWNHSADRFLRFRDMPVCIKRLRVSSFAGTKILELLDGDTSVLVSEFSGKDALADFWSR